MNLALRAQPRAVRRRPDATVRRLIGLTLALLAILFATVTLGAQARGGGSPFGDATNPVINATRVSCLAANRQFVPLVVNRANVMDIAFPTTGPQPTITVGFRFLGAAPDVQLFVFFHVCSHHARGDVRPGDRFRADSERETVADCDAAVRMRTRDMLTPELLSRLRAILPESRVRRLTACSA